MCLTVIFGEEWKREQYLKGCRVRMGGEMGVHHLVFAIEMHGSWYEWRLVLWFGVDGASG